MQKQSVATIADQPKDSVQHCWHIITCEYPPQPGGVSDYTCQVASGLANLGDQVHVWCPGTSGTEIQAKNIFVHRELGSLSLSDLRRLSRLLNQFSSPRRVLVQWVPHGYGYRSMNLPFCLWLWNHSRRYGDSVQIMMHEPFLAFHARALRQNAAALVHRIMTIILLRVAVKVWMSIPAWESRWRPYAFGKTIPFQWLPIPSSILPVDNPSGVEAIRRRYAPDNRSIIGHFGTYGSPVNSVLQPILALLRTDPASQTVLLMGIGSVEFRDALIRKEPGFRKLIEATGELNAEDLSCHVGACDLMIQPYPDGLSSRRTTLMVGLCHGKPVISTVGALSEPFWNYTDAVALVPQGDSERFIKVLQQLRADGTERVRMGLAARKLYGERFDMCRTIATLREAVVAQS
jgi:glycosyltransferase involved in cell wall biosynthesis